MLDISDGIEDEENESIELYKEERLNKEEKINLLKQQDEKIFKKKQEEYNLIISSPLYNQYCQIKEENEKLRFENENLKKQINTKTYLKINDKKNFFEKLKNIFKK